MIVSRPLGCAGTSRTTGMASPADSAADHRVDDRETVTADPPHFVMGQVRGSRVGHADAVFQAGEEQSPRGFPARGAVAAGARSSSSFPRVAIR